MKESAHKLTDTELLEAMLRSRVRLYMWLYGQDASRERAADERSRLLMLKTEVLRRMRKPNKTKPA